MDSDVKAFSAIVGLFGVLLIIAISIDKSLDVYVKTHPVAVSADIEKRLQRLEERYK